MRWQCTFINSKGVRCEKEAIYRLQYGHDHPFEFVDTCEEHKKEFKNFDRVEIFEGE